MGDFGAAVWKRINASKEGPREEFRRALEDTYPKNGEEMAVWSKLTSLENRGALRQFVAYWNGRPISDYARKLYDALVAEPDQHVEG